MAYIRYMEKAPAMKFFLTALAALAVVAPANATIVGDGFTTERFVREMKECADVARNDDFNKFRKAHDACLRQIPGWHIR